MTAPGPFPGGQGWGGHTPLAASEELGTSTHSPGLSMSRGLAQSCFARAAGAFDGSCPQADTPKVAHRATPISFVLTGSLLRQGLDRCCTPTAAGRRLIGEKCAGR